MRELLLLVLLLVLVLLFLVLLVLLLMLPFPVLFPLLLVVTERLDPTDETGAGVNDDDDNDDDADEDDDADADEDADRRPVDRRSGADFARGTVFVGRADRGAGGADRIRRVVDRGGIDKLDDGRTLSVRPDE